MVLRRVSSGCSGTVSSVKTRGFSFFISLRSGYQRPERRRVQQGFWMPLDPQRERPLVGQDCLGQAVRRLGCYGQSLPQPADALVVEGIHPNPRRSIEPAER